MAAFELGDRECGRGWQDAIARLLTFNPNPIPNQLLISWAREKFVYERVNLRLCE